MKGKISVTVDKSLLQFLDSMPGSTRSEKIERMILKLKQVEHEKDLRKRLGHYREDEAEQLEREIWERTIAEAMWSE